MAWFGGEPLLNMPVISQVMTRLGKFCELHGVILEGGATTNGYLLTEQTVDTLFPWASINFRLQ